MCERCGPGARPPPSRLGTIEDSAPKKSHCVGREVVYLPPSTAPAAMNRFIAIFVPIFVWASGASAREGYVETRAGEVYEGHIRFESNTVIIVNAARDLWAQVRFTNVLELTFLEDDGA